MTSSATKLALNLVANKFANDVAAFVCSQKGATPKLPANLLPAYDQVPDGAESSAPQPPHSATNTGKSVGADVSHEMVYELGHRFQLNSLTDNHPMTKTQIITAPEAPASIPYGGKPC